MHSRRAGSLFLILILLISCSRPIARTGSPKSIHQSSIDPAHIDTLLAQERWQEAAGLLEGLILDRPTAKRHLKLGKAYRMLKEWDLAEAHLKTAKEMKSKFAEAYFELGNLYLEGPYPYEAATEQFRWGLRHNPDNLAAYFQRARIRMAEVGYARSLGQWEPLVERAPGYKSCYRLYSRLGFAFHAYDRLCAFLPRLIEAYPDSIYYQDDYLTALYLDRRYEQADETLGTCRTSLLQSHPALWQLHRARIALAQGQDTLAWQAYQKGIDQIQHPREAHAYFKDLQYILTNEEWDAYMKSGIQAKKDFIHLAWKSRDPTLTTDFNERFVEHYDRLRYALRFCKRMPEQRSLEFLLNDFSEPELPPELWMVKLGKTKGSQYQQRIDDLGLVYVRHGDPDKFFTREKFYAPPGGSQKMNLSWHYYAKAGRPAMTFHFWRQQRNIGEANRPRRVQMGWVFRLTPLYPADWSTEATPKEVMESIETGTATTTTNYRPNHPINFAWDQYFFRHANTQARMLMVYEIPPKAQDDLRSLGSRLDQELVVFDGKWRELGRILKKDDALSLAQNPEQGGLRRLSVVVPPGQYFAGFHMQDTQSGREGNTRFTFSNPFRARWLNVSSALLADLAPNTELFAETQIRESMVDRIKPNLRRSFRKGEPIVVYFEIYNILINQLGRSDLVLTIGVTEQVTTPPPKRGLAALFSRKRKPVTVSIEQKIEGTRKTEYLLHSVVLPQYRKGKYTLTLKVKDKNAGLTEERKVDFEIR